MTREEEAGALEPAVCERELTVVRSGGREAEFQTTWCSATAHVEFPFLVRSSTPQDLPRMRALARTMSLRAIAASRTRAAPILPPVIHLNEVEDKLCSLLDEFVQHLEQKDGIQTTCRFAGGWVRDKVRIDNPRTRVSPS